MPLLMTCDKKDDDKSIDQSIAAGDEIFISAPMKSYYDTSEKVRLNERGWICGTNFDKFGLDLLVETNLKRFFVEMKIYCFKDLRNISLFSSQPNPELTQPRRNKNQSWVENQSTFCQMYANGTAATPIWSPSSSFRQWPKSNNKKMPKFACFRPQTSCGNRKRRWAFHLKFKFWLVPAAFCSGREIILIVWRSSHRDNFSSWGKMEGKERVFLGSTSIWQMASFLLTFKVMACCSFVVNALLVAAARNLIGLGGSGRFPLPFLGRSELFLWNLSSLKEQRSER